MAFKIPMLNANKMPTVLMNPTINIMLRVHTMLIADIMLTVRNAVCIMLFVNILQTVKIKMTVHIMLLILC